MGASTASPLKGLRVIDMATIFAGPVAASILSDFGAEVIKVEQPGQGDPLRSLGNAKDGIGLWWKVYARNKQSVTVDLRKEAGQAIIRDLVRDADVLIENYRPGTMERWNLGWEVLHEVNPNLIMLRVTGYGREGPYSQKPGFGTLCEAMSGFAHLNGYADGPPTLPPMAVADGIAALYGAIGILIARLAQSSNSDVGGQVIDVSILDAVFAVLGYQVIEYDQLRVVPTRSGNRSPSSVPRNVYKTKDEKWVAVSSSTDAIARRVIGMVGGERLLADPRFRCPADRREHADELDALVADWVADRSLVDVLTEFERHHAAAAPAYDIAQIFEDAQFLANESIIQVQDEELGNVRMPAVVPKMSATPGRVQFPGKPLGSATRDVVSARTTLTKEQLDQLEELGVI